MSGSVTYVTWSYNASSAVAMTVDINTNGTGSAYAFACQAATPSYRKATSSFLKNRSTSVYPTYTTSYKYTSEFWDVYTVDCQNITHAHGTSPLSASIYYNTTTFTDYTSTAGGTYDGPSPTCLIQPDDCRVVKSSFSKESSAFAKFTSSYTPPFYVVNPPVTPSCTTVCTASQICMIRGDHVRLIYWPVTTTGANSCRSNGTTVTPTATGIQTLESLGWTFTSPSVYISFQSLSAWDWGCYTEIGEGISNTIIGLPPESLSSAVGGHLGRSPVPYNLADLNGFVTSSAYFEMQEYDWSGPGSTILDDLYFPTIWMPEEVLTFRPEWRKCGLSIFGINDPPVALSSVEFLTSEAPKSTSKPNTATPVASPSNTDAPRTSGIALQDQDSSRGSIPATNSAGNYEPQSAMPSANVGGYIASALGYSQPDSQAGSAVTITTVKVITIVTNGFVDGTKTMSVSALLPAGQHPESSSIKDISIGTEGVVYEGSIIALSSFLASPTPVNYQPQTDGSGSTYVSVAGSAIYAGSGIEVGSHTIAVEDNYIVVDGTCTVSYAVAAATVIGSATASNTPYQVMATTDSSGHTIVLIGDEILSISGSAMTIDGHTLSAGLNGVVVDGNGTTIQYASITSGSANSTSSSSSSSSTSFLSFSSNSAFPATTTSSSASRGASHLHVSWSSSIVYMIFSIGFAYGLR